MWTYNNTYELYHHGIIGQKWGIRRYQNPDGTLTEEGRRRYGVNGERPRDSDTKNKISLKRNRPMTEEEKKKVTKTAVIAGAATTGVVLAVIGGNKLSKYLKNKATNDIVKEGNQKVGVLIKKRALFIKGYLDYVDEGKDEMARAMKEYANEFGREASQERALYRAHAEHARNSLRYALRYLKNKKG